ncbi:hypothetical protein [Halocalculus aciditolerans]|nr:hypothetical protein [Halocalculus aciditolerans]
MSAVFGRPVYTFAGGASNSTVPTGDIVTEYDRSSEAVDSVVSVCDDVAGDDVVPVSAVSFVLEHPARRPPPTTVPPYFT